MTCRYCLKHGIFELHSQTLDSLWKTYVYRDSQASWSVSHVFEGRTLVSRAGLLANCEHVITAYTGPLWNWELTDASPGEPEIASIHQSRAPNCSWQSAFWRFWFLNFNHNVQTGAPCRLVLGQIWRPKKHICTCNQARNERHHPEKGPGRHSPLFKKNFKCEKCLWKHNGHVPCLCAFLHFDIFTFI